MCARGARQSEQVQACTVSPHYVPMDTGSQHGLMKENHTFADDRESLASGNIGRPGQPRDQSSNGPQVEYECNFESISYAREFPSPY